MSCLESQGGDCVLAARKCLAHGRVGLRTNQRRIREDDEKIVIARSDRLARGKHRMRGSKPVSFWIAIPASGTIVFASAMTASWFGPATTTVFSSAGFDERVQDMGEHGAAGELMQHLGPRRAHPRALAGGENDCQTRAALEQEWGP